MSYNYNNMVSYENFYRKVLLSESHWLLGIDCEYYECLNSNRDLNSDPRPTYKEPTSIRLVFEDNPKATLKKLNWLAEDEELPYLANISSVNYDKFKEWKRSTTLQERKALVLEGIRNTDGTFKEPFSEFMFDITEFSLVEMPYSTGVEGTQKFTITNVKGDTITPFIHICKLVTHREQVDLKPETPEVDDKYSDLDGGYNYLNVKE